MSERRLCGFGALRWLSEIRCTPEPKSLYHIITDECLITSTAIGVRKAAIDDWRASPILASNFERLPPTHIVTAEFDLSRDESHAYGEILKKHGNDDKVTMKCYAGMPHAFGHYNHPDRGLAKSREYVDDTCEVIRSAHAVAQAALT